MPFKAVVVVRKPFEIPFVGSSLAFDGSYIVDAGEKFCQSVHSGQKSTYEEMSKLGRNESSSVQFEVQSRDD